MILEENSPKMPSISFLTLKNISGFFSEVIGENLTNSFLIRYVCDTLHVYLFSGTYFQQKINICISSSFIIVYFKNINHLRIFQKIFSSGYFFFASNAKSIASLIFP